MQLQYESSIWYALYEAMTQKYEVQPEVAFLAAKKCAWVVTHRTTLTFLTPVNPLFYHPPGSTVMDPIDFLFARYRNGVYERDVAVHKGPYQVQHWADVWANRYSVPEVDEMYGDLRR